MVDTARARLDTPRGRFLLFLSAALLGAALMLSAWQGYRYERLRDAVGALELEQRRWHERNKQSVAELANLRSPQQLDAAAADLELGRIDAADRLLVRFSAPRPPSADGGGS